MGAEMVTGIVSGLLTSILIWFFIVVWQKQIRPWWEDLIYKGVYVDGVWSLEDGSPGDGGDEWWHVESMELRQSAQQLRGSVTLAPRETDDARVDLRVEGEVENGYISLRAKASSSRRISYSTILLHVTEGAGRLVGQTAYLDTLSEEIVGAPVVYRRQRAS